MENSLPCPSLRADAMPVRAGKLRGLRFGFYTLDEIRKLSVMKVTSANIVDFHNWPCPNGLADLRMGTVDILSECVTCGLRKDDCNGHFGHIELATPCFQPLLFVDFMKLMKSACVNCNRFQMDKKLLNIFEELFLNIHLGNVDIVLQAKERLQYTYASLKYKNNKKMKAEDSKIAYPVEHEEMLRKMNELATAFRLHLDNKNIVNNNNNNSKDDEADLSEKSLKRLKKEKKKAAKRAAREAAAGASSATKVRAAAAAAPFSGGGNAVAQMQRVINENWADLDAEQTAAAAAAAPGGEYDGNAIGDGSEFRNFSSLLLEIHEEALKLFYLYSSAFHSKCKHCGYINAQVGRDERDTMLIFKERSKKHAKDNANNGFAPLKTILQHRERGDFSYFSVVAVDDDTGKPGTLIANDDYLFEEDYQNNNNDNNNNNNNTTKKDQSENAADDNGDDNDDNSDSSSNSGGNGDNISNNANNGDASGGIDDENSGDESNAGNDNEGADEEAEGEMEVDSDNSIFPSRQFLFTFMHRLWKRHAHLLNAMFDRNAGAEAFFVRGLLVPPNRLRRERMIQNAKQSEPMRSEHAHTRQLLNIFRANEMCMTKSQELTPVSEHLEVCEKELANWEARLASLLEEQQAYRGDCDKQRGNGGAAGSAAADMALLYIEDSNKKIMEARQAAEDFRRKVEVAKKEQQRIFSQMLDALHDVQFKINIHIDASDRHMGNQIAIAKATEGLRQLIEKKEGLLRSNMMGKRVNYSARSVISPDPYIAVDEIGIPEYFARNLSIAEPVFEHGGASNFDDMHRAVENGSEVYPGANSVRIPADGARRTLREIGAKSLAQKAKADHRRAGLARQITPQLFSPYIVRRHLRNGDYVLLNRQPTLHKPSIMAHRVRILPNAPGEQQNTIRLHYANCATFNADFDGDEMNIHVPQDRVSAAEAQEIVNANAQYHVPKDGTPLRGLMQDNIIAAVLLTKLDTVLDEALFQQLLFTGCFAFGQQTVPHKLRVPVPFMLRPKRLFSGKQLFSALLDNLRLHTVDGTAPANAGVDLGKLSFESKTKVKGAMWNQHKEEGIVRVRHNELLTGVLDKSQIGASSKGFIHAVHELHGANAAGAFLSSLSRLLTAYLQFIGFTCGIDDLVLTDDADTLRRSLLADINKKGIEAAKTFVKAEEEESKQDLGGGDDIDKLDVTDDNFSAVSATLRQRVLGLLLRALSANDDKVTVRLDSIFTRAASAMTSEVVSATSTRLAKGYPQNNMWLMTSTGAKGSAVNQSQISCLLGQQELEGRRVPLMRTMRALPSFPLGDVTPRGGGFVGSRFLTGLSPQEYFFHCMAGREGLMDTAVKTANSGYLQRCLVKQLESLVVHYDYSVRHDDGSIVQFVYGGDALDVTKTSYLDDFDFVAANYAAMRSKVDSSTWELALQDKLAPKCVENVLSDVKASVLEEAREAAAPLTKRARKSNHSSGADDISTSLEFDRVIEESTKREDLHALFDREVKCLQKAEASRKGRSGRSSFKQQQSFADSVTALSRIRFEKCRVDPGEAVGVVAGLSIGEPSTQMTLNTFHLAGRGDVNVTLGIPRLRELLIFASTHTPVMKLIPQRVNADGQYDGGAANATKICTHMKAQKWKDVIVGYKCVEEMRSRNGGSATRRTAQKKAHARASALERTTTITVQLNRPLSVLERQSFLALLVRSLQQVARATTMSRARTQQRDSLSSLVDTVDYEQLEAEAERAAAGAAERGGDNVGEGDDNIARNNSNNNTGDDNGDDDSDIDISADDSSHNGSGDNAEQQLLADSQVDSQPLFGDDIADAEMSDAAVESARDASEASNSIAAAGDNNDNSDDNDDGNDGVARNVSNNNENEDDNSNGDGDDDKNENSEATELSESHSDDSELTAAKKARGKGSAEWTPLYMAKSAKSNIKTVGQVLLLEAEYSRPRTQIKLQLRLKASSAYGAVRVQLNGCIEMLLERTVLLARYEKRAANAVSGDDADEVKRMRARQEAIKNDAPPQQVMVEGLAFEKLFELDDSIVDHSRTYINDPRATAEIYGIEAARACLLNEVVTVFGVYGINIDSRHLSLVVDHMTHSGTIRPFSRRGIANQTSVLGKMTFETTTTFMKQAAMSGFVDDFSNASARIMVGERVSGGTGAFDVRTRITKRRRIAVTSEEEEEEEEEE